MLRIVIALALGLAAFQLSFAAQKKPSAPPAHRSIGALRAQALNVIMALETELEQFKIDVARYPTRAEGLNSLVTRPKKLPGWRGPYVKKIPLDPWKHPYHYGLTPDGQAQVMSYGSDGKKGGKGDAQDIRAQHG